MNCWHCNTELIWGGDHDLEEIEEYDMVSNLSCPNCDAYVEVYRSNSKTQGKYIIPKKRVEEPSPTPDAPWIDEVKTQDGE